MFPWLRTARALVAGMGKPRVKVLNTTRVSLHVWPNDLDINRHVNNGRYLSIADIARMDWTLRTGLFDIARRERAMPVIGDALAKFRRDLKLFQKFEIHTRLLGWDERWAFLEHRFIRDGRVIGVIAVRGGFKGANGVLAPSVFVAGLGIQTPSPPLPQWVQQWSDGCDLLSQSLRDEERALGLRN